MKKKAVIVIVFASLAVITGWNFNQKEKETQMFNMNLTNIEALANNEWEDLYHCSCGLIWGTGCKRDNWGVDCAINSSQDCSLYNTSCSN